MAVAATIWLYVYILALLYGWLVTLGLKKIFKDQGNISSTIQWLLGIAFITTLASFISLVIPVGLIAHLVILAGGIAILIFWLKQYRHEVPTWFANIKHNHWLVWILGALAVLTTFEIATRVSTNADTGQYHAQAIRWIETFRVVPGLGNLLTRFAFNSSWFITNAVFSFAFLGGRSYHLVPGALFLAAIFYSLSGINSLIKKDFRISTLFRSLILPVSFVLLPSEVSSPGTDLPITLITWILISESLYVVETKRENNAVVVSAIWIVAMFVLTIKLSSVVLILSGLFLIFSRKGINWKKYLVWNGLVAVIILLPWLIRNVIISGYLIYPLHFIDIFNFDWKIPAVNAQSDMHAIQNWARLSGRVNSVINPNKISSWLPQWWGNLTLFRKSTLLSITVMPFIYVIFIMLRSIFHFKIDRIAAYYAPVYLIAYLGVIFWFLSAPEFRFGNGYIMSALILVLAPILLVIIKRFKKFTYAIAFLIVVTMIGYQTNVFLRSLEIRTLVSRLIYPADYRELPTEPCILQNTTVLTPTKDAWSECWYAPFPCTPHCETGVKMRGNTLQDGYRWP